MLSYVVNTAISNVSQFSNQTWMLHISLVFIQKKKKKVVKCYTHYAEATVQNVPRTLYDSCWLMKKLRPPASLREQKGNKTRIIFKITIAPFFVVIFQADGKKIEKKMSNFFS